MVVTGKSSKRYIIIKCRRGFSWTAVLWLVALAAPVLAHEMGGQPEWAAFGAPGKPGSATRTIALTAGDMRFSIKNVDVKAGETVRFVITNRGPSRHEFVIGTKAFHIQHLKEMEAMPDMAMDEANAVDLNAGQTRTLVWQFTRPGDYLFGCDIPGHFQAGMSGTIKVR